jgi:lipid-A-disaccharide synthase
MCKIAVAASGTITLQIALKKIPVCVFYKISNATYFIIKFLIKTNFISLINILLEKKVVQEFVQSQASEKNIIGEINKIIQNSDYRKNLIKEISSIEEKLKDKNSMIDINEVIKKSL